jgi:hypothetical protein
MVVNLDYEPLVREGEAGGLDGWPAERVEEFVASGWIPAPTSEDMANVLADPALREFVAERERRFPTAAFTTPFPDSGGRRWQVPHVFLACTEAAVGEPFTDEDVEQRAAMKADPRWQYQELPVNHLGLLYARELVAGALLDLL